MQFILSGSPRRRGAAAVFVAVTMFVLLGFACLTLDAGYYFNTHGEVQAASDSAALAGASACYTDPMEIKPRAIRFGEMNLAAQGGVKVPGERIVYGKWNSFEGAFTPTDDPAQANAVRVFGQRDDVSYFFAGMFGITNFDTTRMATGYRPPACSGVWGLEGVTVSGDATTDSFNSLAGPYDPDSHLANGDVCSNKSIEVIGSAMVDGTASSGPGHDIDVIGAAEVTGTMAPGGSFMEFPPPDFGDIRTVNDNSLVGMTDRGRDPYRGGELDLYVSSGYDNLTLPPGEYHFSSININSQATITVTGPTVIFVSGDVRSAGGSIVNSTGDPHNLTIYSIGETFEMYGGTGFYGTVYAPGTDITLKGNSSYYGSIVGKTLDIGGTADMHIDESLPIPGRDYGDAYLVE